jgi:hypothetical protein
MEINQTTPLDKAVNQFDEFLLKPRGDKLIRINISRNTLIAIIFSLLVHGLLLIVMLPKIDFDNAASPQPTALEVSLAPPTPPKVEIPEPTPVKPEPEVKKSPPKVITRKPSKNTKPSTFSVPDVIATKQPTPEPTPPKEVKPNDAPTDMASYVKAQQAKRNAMEADAARQNAEAVAREVGPSENEKRNQRISKNLGDGAGGMFSSPNISGTHATFSFNGWTGLSNQRQEFFEVEAKPNQDIRLLIIKRMIRVIREKKSGDFPWESQRLGREIIKSARLEDNAELEEFLMMEIFGSNYKNTPY